MSKKGKLATVCALLNAHRAKYVVVGGFAVSLHGAVRTTLDLDILIEPTLDNAKRTLAALSQLPFGVAADVTPEEVIGHAVTMIGYMPHVDILTVAWSVRFADAKVSMIRATIDGVTVPFLDVDLLIRSKQTGRLQDAADIELLEKLRAMGSASD